MVNQIMLLKITFFHGINRTELERGMEFPLLATNKPQAL